MQLDMYCRARGDRGMLTADYNQQGEKMSIGRETACHLINKSDLPSL